MKVTQKSLSDDPSIFFSDTFIYLMNTFGAIVSGLGAALLWVSQGIYIAECATERTKGFFFGFFWSFQMGSQIVGNLFAAYVFKGGHDMIGFYMIMSGLAIISSGAYIFCT